MPSPRARCGARRSSAPRAPRRRGTSPPRASPTAAPRTARAPCSSPTPFSAELLTLVTAEAQEGLERALVALRGAVAHEPLADAAGAPVTRDYVGADIAAALAPSADGAPLIVLLRRTNRRSFNETHLRALVAELRARSPRLLVLELERLSGAAQLRVAAAADALVGAHGNGLAHLLWAPAGSVLVEVFPHWRSDGVEGTGFANDYCFLTRLKGAVYRSLDCERGAFSPIKHSVSDLAHQLHIGELRVDAAAVAAEVDAALAVWRSVRARRAAGERVDLRSEWHPLYTGEEQWKE
jgi:hypothetical protein